MPAACDAAFLPLVLVEPFLRKLEAPDHDPLKQVAELSQLRRQWLLWRASGRVLRTLCQAPET